MEQFTDRCEEQLSKNNSGVRRLTKNTNKLTFKVSKLITTKKKSELSSF